MKMYCYETCSQNHNLLAYASTIVIDHHHNYFSLLQSSPLPSEETCEAQTGIVIQPSAPPPAVIAPLATTFTG